MFTNKCHRNKGFFFKNFFESVKWYLNLFFAIIIYIYISAAIFLPRFAVIRIPF